jgi:hypothetical protein
MGVMLTSVAGAVADEVRYYDKDGLTYRESRRVINRPIMETRYQDCPRTIYRQHLRTEMSDMVRHYQVPVTEYRWESHWRGRYNPFVQPYLAQRLVGRTYWENRTEIVQVPLSRTEIVPETTTVRLPVSSPRMVEEEVTTRVVVGSSRSSDPFAAGGVQEPERFGGIANLDKDPPRRSSAASNKSGLAEVPSERRTASSKWKPATERR